MPAFITIKCGLMDGRFGQKTAPTKSLNIYLES